MQLQEINGIIVCEKPTGMSTHANDSQSIGYAEWLESKQNRKLYLYQRLDLGTSGIISFALTSAKAAAMTKLWQEKRISKKYLFITDRKFTEQEFTVNSAIRKEKGQWVSTAIADQANSSETTINGFSKTHFQLLNKFGPYSLWQATPYTGKPHQIRLHAQAKGIAILGDHEHGGNPFHRLCLHSESLTIPDYGQFKSLAPKYFYDLAKLENPMWCQLEDAWLRRQMLYPTQNSLRLLHNEIGSVKIDKFGDCWWVYDYGLKQNQLQTVKDFLSSKNCPSYYIREMKNRGEAPLEAALVAVNSPPEKWLSEENSMRLELRHNQGLSPGLFLDQRANRLWVKQHAKNKTVLNLFSYTGAFSVAAALGGAMSVTTVDLSSTFIEWSKENFRHNHLSPENYEFWAADVRVFLNGASKRHKHFDLIICDPPSFSRGKNSIFRVEKDTSILLRILWNLLAPGGHLLYSTNYEKWAIEDLQAVFKQLQITGAKFIRAPLADLDFELPQENHILKTLLIEKIEQPRP